MVDLHRHDEFSSFDGFGKSKELAALALSLGHTSLSTTNHGTIANWAQHWFDCKEAGIKPILGVEAYFKPSEDIEGRGWHLCLYAKNFKGYENINKLMFIAEKYKYYNPIIILKDLAKYSEGVICSTACIASYTSCMIKEGNKKEAFSMLKKFKSIFDDDLYIELQPYKIDGIRTQEKVDMALMSMAKKLNIKCILTSDSHYGAKEDFDTYLKMHEIAKHGYDINATYGERYMPTEKQLIKRFVALYKDDYFDNKDDAIKYARKCIKNIEEIENKCEDNYLDDLNFGLPVYDENVDSKIVIKQKVKDGLKKRNKYKKSYVERCKFELDVIDSLGYNDYFLMVADYVNYAKDNNIPVGPGRGSGCNSLVCFALGITDVDSLMFNLDFGRFMRKDKKKMPDIDLDFATDRRDEVISYIVKKYKGHAAQIASYGLYKVDNLLNDLFKVCCEDYDNLVHNKDSKKQIMNDLKAIKKIVKQYVMSNALDEDALKMDKSYVAINNKYDNILKHFAKMFGKVRFISTHAAGVAISKDKLLTRVGMKKSKDEKIFTVFDLKDVDKVGVTKFDILGLKTMQELGELRKITNTVPAYEEWVKDEKIMKAFREGNTEGIFQYESETAKTMLMNIKCSSFNDLVAVSAMNRPGPLQLKMPEQYMYNKMNKEESENSIYYQYTKDTYGTIIYQEQIQRIVVNLAGMSWDQADKIIKMSKEGVDKGVLLYNEYYDEYVNDFVKGMKKCGMSRQEAIDLFDKFFVYSFNQGHATGYALISLEEMYYKVNYPLQYWAVKLKMQGKDDDKEKYKGCAVRDGCLIVPPHINGTALDCITKLHGDKVIQEGLCNIKGVGEKAAINIERMKPFIDYPEFEEKWQELPKEQKRTITKGTVKALQDAGCFVFTEDKMLKRIEQYNVFLYTHSCSSH